MNRRRRSNRRHLWKDGRLQDNGLARNGRLADNERLRIGSRRLRHGVQRPEIGRQPIALVHSATELLQALVRLSPDPAQ